jgi:phenylalanyl-tRNA synthetase beta chain|uniref:Phenylalanine--tRNA ligase beta subunit n=1 Tax=Thermomicrobium roseum TaxID=500 RepID=A0A7C1JXD2_THERO
MKVPMRWLRELVATDLSADELAERLTLAGLEVESIERIGAHWDNIYVGVVERIEPHPNADRLVLATVNAGAHRLTVVTGAPNIAVGQKVALALAGATLYDGHSAEPKLTTLKPATIRGVRSEGMVCSEKELGLSEEHEGIMVLDPDAPVGMPLREYLGDEVLELAITPNRVDAFSIVGVAREVAALTGAPFQLPALATLEAPVDPILATIEATDLCARFVGVALEGIRVEPSPWWIRRRLQLVGIRPINNVVDVTNYVMVEWGQPQHAFDRARLREGRIVVRRARPGEEIETLDHIRRVLTPDTLVIADAERPVGIAGVMGGLDSEITEETTSVLLETANFHMLSIRRTARAQRLRTEASARFERGLDPNLCWPAAQRAVRLLTELIPTCRVVAFVDHYPSPRLPRRIELPRNEIPRLLGVDYPDHEVLQVFQRLGFVTETHRRDDRSIWIVEVPTYRSDVTIPADLVEEVARVIGYDSLPERLPVGQTVPVEIDPELRLIRQIQNGLVAAGLHEIITYPMVDDETLLALSSGGDSVPERLGFYQRPSQEFVRARNPIRPEWSIMRPSLIPTLLRNAAEQLKFNDAVAVFETGKVYLPRGRDELPDERRAVGCLLAGLHAPRDLYHEERPVDFFDLKGILETLLPRLGAQDLVFRPIVHPTLQPGRSAELVYRGMPVGILGEVLVTIAERFGIAQHHRVVVAEFDIPSLIELGLEPVTIRPISRYQPIEQDFAIVVDEATPAADVAAAIRAGAGPLAAAIRLFDVYRGPAIPPGKKSLAFRVILSAPDRALSDAELQRVRERIEQQVRRRVKGEFRR